MKQGLNGRYDKRGGTIPDTPTRGFLIDNLSEETSTHLEYLSRISDQRFSIWTSSDLTSLRGALAVPYINTPTTENYFQSAGIDIWGPPALLVHNLKNKATSHALAKPHSKNGFEVPEFTVCELDDLEEAGQTFFTGVKKLYQQTDLNHQYPPGLVIRGAESDGGHGGCQIVETETGYKLFEDGENKPQNKNYSLNESLKAARDYLLTTASAQTNIESRAVITRRMQLLDSPGLSILIKEGQYFSIGWNGQIDPKYGTASFGTQTYLAPNPQAKEFQNQYEDSSAEDYFNFIKQTSRDLNIPFEKVTGFFNVDLMIPGRLEQKLRGQLGLEEETIYYTESNPRWTNLNDAAMAVSWANKPTSKITAAHIFEIISNGLLTRDKVALPPNTNLTRLRNDVESLDEYLRQELETRIILRMPS